MNDIVRRNDPFDLFSRFGEPFFGPAARAEWRPAVDIQETENGYTFHMDVPGMKPADLDVELHEGVLSIRGSRAETKEETDKGYVRIERRRGSFTRQFRVPVSVQPDNLKAEVKDGVLTINVPKGVEPSARKVTVS